MNLRSLIVVVMLLLAGCATLERAREVQAPAGVVSPATWQQIDRDIVAASQDATAQARVYARGSMDHWRVRVYERTEENFIPWFDNYWTQEWLSIKVSWYALSAGNNPDPSAARLTAYLQEQYHERVLAPVALEIDPDAIMGQATEFYVQMLGQRLQTIAQRYRVSPAQLDQRLNGIPAISLAPPPANNASLYQTLHAAPLAKLPAYVALINHIHTAGGAVGVGSVNAGISSVAKSTSDKLESQFPSRGIAGAVAAGVGRVAGAMISLGVAGVRAITQEIERPDTHVHVRTKLGAAFDKEWLQLMTNPTTGVMAGVNYLSGQIEGSLAKSLEVAPSVSASVSPPVSPSVSQAIPQSDAVPLPQTYKADDGPGGPWRPDQ